MGFFSNFFGNDKPPKALESAFAKIRRLVEDEDFQLELIPPEMQQVLRRMPAYDISPNGTGPFGFVRTNPVPVNGPVGEIAYLSKLQTVRGERIIFHRLGSVDKIDVYEAVTLSGGEWFIFYLDFYHPRASKLAPQGFQFVQELALFSGFNKPCQNFPYGFLQLRDADQSDLRYAYMPMHVVAENLQRASYSRPDDHKKKVIEILAEVASARTPGLKVVVDPKR